MFQNRKMKRAAASNRRVLLAFGMALSMVCSAQVQTEAIVHIYRYRLAVNQAAHPTVSCDAFPVVRIQNGRVYTMKVSAGRHIFTTVDNQTGVQVDVEPGKEYFVRVDYTPNAVYIAHAAPVLVPPEQGSREIKELRKLDGRFIEAATCGRP
jgi:hypothetical protein